jgi:hypothetical protein
MLWRVAIYWDTRVFFSGIVDFFSIKERGDVATATQYVGISEVLYWNFQRTSMEYKSGPNPGFKS